MGFRSKAKAFFVDVDSPAYTLNEPVNIILSPSMYWVKRVKLPVKYLHEVKSLMPSLFEDNLPHGKYSYSTYRDGEYYLLFAYNDKEVLDLIAKKGIVSANIGNIYLAQSEFDTIDEPISIDEKSILGLQNGVVVKLPAALAKEAKELDLSEHTFSKHSIHLTRFNQIADKKSQVVFATILGILIAMFTAEWMITSAKVSSIMEKESEVFAKHNLPSTSFQNEAIYAKYNTIFEQQTRIRDLLDQVLSLELKADEQILHVTFDKNKVSIEIKTPSKEQGAKSLSGIANAFKRTGERYADGIYTMELQI